MASQLATQFESCTRLTDMMGEFPRIDDRFAGAEISLRLDAGHRHPTKPVELKGGSAGGLIMNTLGLGRHRDRRGAELVVRPGLVAAGALLHPARARTRRKATAGS